MRAHGLAHLNFRVITVLAFGALGGCSDDDDVPDSGTNRDAGPRDSGARDVGDGSTQGDAMVPGHDAETDASADAGFQCKSERFPLWKADFQGETFATRVPLEVYCRTGRCPRSLQDYLQGLMCEELDDAGAQDIARGEDPTDGGAEFGDGWLRSDGCGSVQFTTLHPGWPRDFNFDAVTGELIGAAHLDDIGTPLAGTPCEAAGYVAGTFRASCAGEVLMICTPRR